jgi:hypothetical protein
MDRDIVGVIKGKGWTATMTRSKGWAVEGEDGLDPEDLQLVTNICKAHDPEYIAATRTLAQSKFIEALTAAGKVLGVQPEYNPAYTRDHQTEAYKADAADSREGD